MAVPSEPRKRPKAPATELPSKGNDTMSKYMKSNMGTTKNQAITERPVIERKWEIPIPVGIIPTRVRPVGAKNLVSERAGRFGL
jgi:hypothetical protein